MHCDTGGLEHGDIRLTLLSNRFVNTGWPRKNATFSINNFKKTRDRIYKSCVHYCVKTYNSFFSKMTPRALVLMKAF